MGDMNIRGKNGDVMLMEDEVKEVNTPMMHQ